jgi:hypothetical protein
MKIRFLSGPRQGETSHAPYGQQTQLLIAAGIIEVVNEPKPRYGSTAWLEEKQAVSAALNPPCPVPTVSWDVKLLTLPTTGEFGYAKRPAIVASCSNANCVVNFRFDGPTFRVVDKKRVEIPLDGIRFLHSCGYTLTDAAPAHIIAEYRAAYGDGGFEYTSDEAAVVSFSALVGDSNKHREILKG